MFILYEHLSSASARVELDRPDVLTRHEKRTPINFYFHNIDLRRKVLSVTFFWQKIFLLKELSFKAKLLVCLEEVKRIWSALRTLWLNVPLI